MIEKRDHGHLGREATKRAGAASSSYLRGIYQRIAKRHSERADRPEPGPDKQAD